MKYLILLLFASNVFAISDEEREYCLQQSYDAKQVASNKLRGVPEDDLLQFLANIPSNAVPEGYIESNMMTTVEVYEMDFETEDEAQQKSLVKCLNWHNAQTNELTF